MDYMLNPIICTIWCSKAAMNIVPEIPYAVWAVFFAVLFTGLNLRGIRATARTNEVLVGAMSIVVVYFFVQAVRYVLPFLPQRLLHAAFLRSGDVLLAGRLDRHLDRRAHLHRLRRHLDALGGGREPAAQHPAGHGADLPDHRRAGHAWRSIRASWCGPTTRPSPMWTPRSWRRGPRRGRGPVSRGEPHAAGGDHRVRLRARNSGPRACCTAWGETTRFRARFFGVLDPKRGIPRNNVLFTGALALAGAFLMSYQLGAEMLNFGAFIAFMGVNVAAFTRYFLRQQEKKLVNLLPPVLGFLICVYIWLSLAHTSQGRRGAFGC